MSDKKGVHVIIFGHKFQIRFSIYVSCVLLQL